MWPASLKNRLFASFLLVVFVPLTALFFYLFHQIEKSMQEKAIIQSASNLAQARQRFDDALSMLTKAFYIVEKDPTISSILINPSRLPDFERSQIMEDKIRSLDTSLFLYHSPQVYYTVADFYGNLYSSFIPRYMLDYEDFMKQYESAAEPTRTPYRWITDDKNYVSRDFTTAPDLLTLFGTLMDVNNQPMGYARLSFDYRYWFHSTAWPDTDAHQYALVSADGRILASTGAEWTIPPETLRLLGDTDQTEGYYIDKSSSYIIVYSYIPFLQWHLVGGISRDALFAEVNALQRSYFGLFCAFASLFILTTFLISAKITRPLNDLSRRMSAAVRNGLEVTLPVSRQKGEILELTVAFNKMIRDLKKMMERLKEEQLQKETIRFQMLMSQMNPHFLFNTLNTIKWIALREDKPEIAEICISLGKLLETSLNVDADLIHVRTELEMIQAYIHIQRYKHKHRIECDIAVEEELMYALVPKLSIQPLVENAFVHGLAAAERDGRVRVSIRREQSRLIVEVADNGIGMEEAKRRQTTRKRKGIGLENVKDRIRLLFRDKGEFEVASSDRGTTVTLRIPLLIAKPFQHGGDRGVESADRRG